MTLCTIAALVLGLWPLPCKIGGSKPANLVACVCLHVLDMFSLNYIEYADPYLNTDAGTMSPFEHGEVFVLDDGGEVLIVTGHKVKFC